MFWGVSNVNEAFLLGVSTDYDIWAAFALYVLHALSIVMLLIVHASRRFQEQEEKGDVPLYLSCVQQGMSLTTRPTFIRSTSEIPERTHVYPQSTEPMGPERRFGKEAGLERIGINIQRLPLGSRSSWPHAEVKGDASL